MANRAAETSEFVMAFLDFEKDARNNKKLWEFVCKCYVNKLKMSDFCKSLFEHLKARNSTQISPLIHKMLCKYAQDDGEASFQVERDDDPLIVHDFFHDLSCLYEQQQMMLKPLQAFHDSSVEKLDATDTWMMVCATFFTAAAVITTAVAAAAATANAAPKMLPAAAAGTSILFLALGKWSHSLLQKRETAVKKHMKIIGVMNTSAQFIIEELKKFHGVACRLVFQTESMSEMADDDVDVSKKVAALNESFEELRGKANDFSRDMWWARDKVLQKIITHSN